MHATAAGNSLIARIAGQPIWLVGFRPFFALACLAGLLLPAAWALIFAGVLPPPATRMTSVQWHAHEMFYGFGWAVLGGFLLTATKNWVQIRGYHGPALLLLAAAWVVERFAVWHEASLPPALFLAASNLFLGALVLMLVRTLVRHRETDTFRDNYFFLALLPAFLVAKALLLSAESFDIGVSMTIGLFRLAFLVMLERTLTPFMKGIFQVEILRQPQLDLAIKLLGLLLVIESVVPAPVAAALATLLAALLLFRFAFWAPLRAMRRIDLTVMYLGYLAIVGQLLMVAASRLWSPDWVGAVAVHVFTLGAMGLVIPAMIVRIVKGHTGRKVTFDVGDKLVLWLMLTALVLRVVAPQLLPAGYGHWIAGSALCWSLAFGVLAWRYIPLMCRPRVDGREH